MKHAIVIIAGLAALAIVGTLDVQQNRDDTKHYCEMVAIWNESAYMPEAERPGWPPFRDDVTCEE